ncbi:MAG: HAMP domain-containing sensor histidine kinase [Brevundimonas sp.]|uniref:HAMP domain-containing sensor histidine kinase n=1 Tax=Brevundimonas sp. TaxID=1871086 RepID=UPI0027287554|nr:HAMP domain-containing sensor histidine kinase [Brevundimonas sp.]MDO9588791.1 HAMP domain-containing sensor histidine kinase [Brevundimonas sp.]MDP3368585.1 HAMP domain-containing sensor histidine kinase [Brevundimonas sp.]
MASDIAIARADPLPPGEAEPRRRLKRFGGSRLGGLILALNLLSLLILFVGALLLNEWSRGLIEARQETLTAQAELLVRVLGDERIGVTRGEPTPSLDPIEASRWLRDNFLLSGQRARLFDIDGIPVADSFDVTEAIPGRPLPPALSAGTPPEEVDPAVEVRNAADVEQARAVLGAEVEQALGGEPQASLRRSESGDRVVSVSIPVRHVRQVLGVLTLEAGDVDETLDAQRRALMPFALVALAVNLLGSLLLHLFVARPVMRLSAAADEVRLQRARAISLPDLEHRKDEIGDLARSLETMTETLSDRMDAIEAFAADVSHEIKNPLTSIRSALETLPLVKTPEQREKLTLLLQQDVRRLDRLITDISNASRLDAELNRDRPRTIDLTVLLSEIVGVYESGLKPGEAHVAFAPSAGDHVLVVGRDGPLGQVFRNLIDNARSFSPPDGAVRISLVRDEMDPDRPVRVRVDDDGPGIPPENLETVFERFYTARPRGVAFGANSGLGLSIVRQIVEAHGGRVRAENRPGPRGEVAGARFEVALPTAPPAGRRP